MNVVILIDYDNLEPNQKAAGILDVVTRVLFQLPKPETEQRATCDVRLYGGWYEGSVMTKLAQDLSSAIQDMFPAVVRVANQAGTITLVSVNAALAMSLIEEPAHHLLNTFRKKGRPNNVRIQAPQDVGCSNSACALPLLKKMLRTGVCTAPNCTVTAPDLVYRSEQKIVDTMLTCDLLHSQHQQLDHIVLISSDDDFIPPVRTLMLQKLPIVRVHPKANAQRQAITSGHLRLNELEL